MKIRSFMMATLSVLAIAVGFTSCSSDDDEWSWSKEGSKIEMSESRAFIINEGSMGKNNATMTYFDWKTDNVYANDLFATQNGVLMGDVAQDIIVDGKQMYVIMSGSKYIFKLNTVGVREGGMSIPSDLSDPRYGVIDGGYLYVTCYGGYVAKINTKTMSVEGKVQIGLNPEYIIKYNGKLYCTCSGWGKDKRVAVIDLKSFSKADYFDVMDNPDHIIEVGGHIYVQGYGAYYDYPFGELDPTTGKFTEMGNCSSIAGYQNTLYVAYSATDWSTYETTTTFTSYDVRTGKATPNFLKNAPAELASSSVYGMNVNEKTGDLYVMTTNFTTNGQVYHFKGDGTFVRKFDTTGVNPRKIVFLD